MERLTFDGNFCEIAQCREMPCQHGGSCTQRKVWERLKAYEDTGLAPNVCANYKKFEDEAISNDVTFKRIVELMNADADGRVMVLPCKIGDAVWYVTKAGILGFAITSFDRNRGGDYAVSDFSAFPIRLFGKNVFLTREEAEAKLREGQKNG
jgi:hypothetical protein|nr:MAG TPA_asm: hypothetical protein [Caudoviricetes sp.]